MLSNDKMSLKKPKISIVMSVYDDEKFLNESMESILNQTFKDFEFIIINDASTDNSLEVIKKYMKKDRRIVLINNKNNVGLTANLNKGLKMARGKYIARMDADDISLPKRLEIQYDYLEKNPNIFLVGGSAIVIDETGKRLGIFEKKDDYKKIRKKLLKIQNPIIHPSVLYRSEGIRYREKLNGAEDYDLYLRLLNKNKKITNVSDFLIKYRITEGSVVSTKIHKINILCRIARDFYSQRVLKGKDSYDQMDFNKIKRIDIPKNFPDFNLKTKILVKFQDNKMKNTRTDIKLYFKKYGIEKNLLFIYILSFIPYSITKFIKETLF